MKRVEGCPVAGREGGRWQFFLLTCFRFFNLPENVKEYTIFGSTFNKSINKLNTWGVEWRSSPQSGEALVSRSAHLLNMEHLKKQNCWSWTFDTKIALAKLHVANLIFNEDSFSQLIIERQVLSGSASYLWRHKPHKIHDTLNFEAPLLKVWQKAHCRNISWELVEVQSPGLSFSLLKQNL